MRRSIAPLFRLFGCALLVLCGLPLPAGAADGPAITPPRTYHYHAEATVEVEGIAVRAVADGDYDVANRAFHAVSTGRAEGAEVRLELILLDGKLYTYDARQRRWVYLTVTADEVEALFADLLRVPPHPTASYAPDGEETIEGDRAARWRASNRYNLLLPALTARGFTGSLVEETLTIELAIGVANGYLYRAVAQESGKATSLGGGQPRVGPVASKSVYNYGKFNQPVAIVAPPDAVPLDGLIGALAAPEPGVAGTAARALLTSEPGGGFLPRLAGLAVP